jgi:hypothetical protein
MKRKVTLTVEINTNSVSLPRIKTDAMLAVLEGKTVSITNIQEILTLSEKLVKGLEIIRLRHGIIHPSEDYLIEADIREYGCSKDGMDLEKSGWSTRGGDRWVLAKE